MGNISELFPLVRRVREIDDARNPTLAGKVYDSSLSRVVLGDVEFDDWHDVNRHVLVRGNLISRVSVVV